ncbi:putative acetyltransferase [Actinacidiphila reveromycinica]|uniref:Putative acetyltransferase n=1 Tax=Actinacidiphila reveromycinica TaxID=659352 RepID=A0A7U3US12_9ACTN|nr:GNAT family N-acetyltransferase [Streptomyces sp. SN-593]BBA97675.1 putative acetyltransferase [Streptomyces sp. SN-593]
METPVLTTKRLVLRALEPRDGDALWAACQDPEISRWTSVPWPYPRERADDFINVVCADGWRDDSMYNFGVFTRDEGVLVSSMGLVRLQHLAAPQRMAELGYWTAKHMRGKGYTVEAARAVCSWAFDTLGVERLEWFAEAGNEASRAVALKLGFAMEGTVRAMVVHAGTRRDAWSGSLLPSDWDRPSEAQYLPYTG